MQAPSPELIDAVIDQLHDHKSALLTCSLVNKEWLPRSRMHAFASIDLPIYYCPVENQKVVERLTDFVSLLSSPVATFVSSIVEVYLSYPDSGYERNTAVFRDGTVAPVQYKSARTPRTLRYPYRKNRTVYGLNTGSKMGFTYLCTARKLNTRQTHAIRVWVPVFLPARPVTGPVKSRNPDIIFASFLPGPQSLPIASPSDILLVLERHGVRPRSLKIDYYPRFIIPFNPTPPGLVSSVEKLELSVLGCEVSHAEPQRASSIPPAPKSIALPPTLTRINSSNGLLHNWIMTLTPVPKQLTTVELSDFGKMWCPWSDINPFLRSPAAEAIETLAFTGGASPREGAGGSGPNLNRIRKLKHLVVSINLGATPGSILEALTRLCSTPAFDFIETVSMPMTMHPTGRSQYHRAQWTNLDAKLCSLLPRLRAVTFSRGSGAQDDQPDAAELAYRAGGWWRLTRGWTARSCRRSRGI
ncbi:hypothetical protein C8F01DRAFT_1232358 [Mycena amicta]|nr:hypothetical protein C8F01DRAFT_1232358 [Mycena amicta]